jgi:hypothetical protein
LNLLSVALLLVSSCAQSRPSVQPNGYAHQQETIMAKPFWIREAGLPEGFPPPGPVGKVIVKQYPSYRMARFAAREGQPANQDQMFWPLFKHIKRNDIAMTAPVEMGYPAAVATRPEAAASAKPLSMAFLYRQPTLGTTGADQADPRVVVENVPAMTVLSVGMRGNYNAIRLAKALRQIDQWMNDNPSRIEVVGQPRYLGYNSPMVPGFLRYGEVQLPVRDLTPSSQPAPAQPGSVRSRSAT